MSSQNSLSGFGRRSSSSNGASQPTNSTHQAAPFSFSGLSSGAAATPPAFGQPRNANTAPTSGGANLGRQPRHRLSPFGSAPDSSVQSSTNATEFSGGANSRTGFVSQPLSLPSSPASTTQAPVSSASLNASTRTPAFPLPVGRWAAATKAGMATPPLGTIAPTGSASGSASAIGINHGTGIPGRLQLHLFKGHGMDVIVGRNDASSFSNHGTETWSLPTALMCHYSPFLRAASTRDFVHPEEHAVRLPDVDPKTFGLFVEWMYYGTYTLTTQRDVDLARNASADAKAWVLGDKLLSTDFKNYAMNRLYAQYAAPFGLKPVRIIDVKYACMHSAVGSPLRRLFSDLATTYFQNSERVLGTMEEWDQILLEHADVRTLLLDRLRKGTNQPLFIKDKDAYLEKEPVQPPTESSTANENTTTPAKRTVDGEVVKKEPTDS